MLYYLINMPKSQKPSLSETKIKSDTVIGSKYAQAATITVSDIDITIEFIFINQRSKEGETISRITLPRPSGEDLAKTILTTVKSHELKKKGKTHD